MKYHLITIIGSPVFLSSFGQVADAAPKSPCPFPVGSAVYSGEFTDLAGSTPQTLFRRFTGIDSTADLVVTGTSLTVACVTYAPAVAEARVDGGAWVDITP